MMMKSTQEMIRRCRWFFAGLLVCWLTGICLLIWQGSAQAFLLIRVRGGAAADMLFRYITHLGDGFFAILLVLILVLLKRYAFAFVLAFGYAVSGLLAQLLKHLFSEWRPAPHFRNMGIEIHAVDGVDLLQSATSFPSGHTTSAFALATALVLMNRWWQHWWLLGLALASLAGYSRIYLGQHFLQDVLAGSLLGVLTSVAGYALLYRWQPPFLRKGR